MKRVLVLVAVMWMASVTHAAIVIDFENTPPLPVGPSRYNQAGAMQTITIPGIVEITGGVVLGNPTGFPQAPYASLPNVYGTASSEHSTLTPIITIQFDPDFSVSEVGGTLFSGYPDEINYWVKAYDGTTLVDSQFFDNVPYDSSGFRYFTLTGDNITSVTIAGTTSLGWWNFAVDDVVIVPEPATLLLVSFGALALLKKRTA